MLELSLKILEAVANSRSGMTVSDVYSMFGMPKSSASILLWTFVNLNYMTRDKAGFFHIGPKALEIGSHFVEYEEGYAYAGRVLDDLVKEVGETAHLGILNGTDVVYVCKSDCIHAVRMISQIGKQVPAHATALGKALLSTKTDSEIRSMYKDKPLEQLTSNTIVSLDKLIKQLHQIRSEGFAMEREESTEGVSCIAIPLRGKIRGGAAAVSVSVPIIRLSEGLERFKKPLSEAGELIKSIL